MTVMLAANTKLRTNERTNERVRDAKCVRKLTVDIE